MSRHLRAAAVLAVVAVLAACGALANRVYTCATDTLPPVAVDPIVCHNGLPAVRWFSAVEGSPQPQPGLPLDYAWWHGGTGTIGYGRGYDPRPREVWIHETRYLPYSEPVRQVPAAPPGADQTADPVKRGGLGVPGAKPGKAQVDPPKPAAKPAAPPKPRTTNR
jgi:hypothetical protein